MGEASGLILSLAGATELTALGLSPTRRPAAPARRPPLIAGEGAHAALDRDPRSPQDFIVKDRRTNP